MTSARPQEGFTLVELLVSMMITLVVFGAVVTALTVFQRENRSDQLRNEAQDNARTMIDRLSRELRSVASPKAATAGALEKATAYDLVFQTVSAGQVYAGNPSNQERVRYCLDANQTLWKQTQTWTSSTAPVMPDTTTCPSTSNSTGTVWGSQYAELSNVTNTIGGDTRAVFNYGPTGWATVSQIKLVEVNLFVDQNPGQQPGPTQVTSGIYLRNSLSPPTANFSVTQVNHDVQLNASTSYDPNGQVLSYQWYNGGTCPTPSNPLTSGTTQQYDAGTSFTKGSNQTFALVVTDTGGLTNCASQVVTIQ